MHNQIMGGRQFRPRARTVNAVRHTRPMATVKTDLAHRRPAPAKSGMIVGSLAFCALVMPMISSARAEDDDMPTQASHSTILGPGTSIMLGAGAALAPAYEGANTFRVSPIPLVEIHGLFDDRVFISGTEGLGVNVVKIGGFRAGLAVSYNAGRLSSDSSRLKGLSDISGSAALTGFMSYNLKPFQFDLKIRNDFGPNPGTVVSLGASYGFHPLPKLQVAVGPELTWADSRYDQSYFGVSAAGAARATSEGNPLQAYNPGAGLKDVGLSLRADYQLTEHWGLVGHVGLTELVGSAARNSPLTQRDFQPSAALGAVYRF